MMWVEASFSSLLLFSATMLALSAPEPSGAYQKNWAEYSHLNDAAHSISSKLSDKTRALPVPGGIFEPAPQSGVAGGSKSAPLPVSAGESIASDATEAFASEAQPVLAAAGAASDAAEVLASEAQFILGAQSSIDSLSRNTPYCLELTAKNYPLHAISCRGAAAQAPLPSSVSSSFSVERSALHNGLLIVFSLRQWTDKNR